jgi:hypothetical protein
VRSVGAIVGNLPIRKSSNPSCSAGLVNIMVGSLIRFLLMPSSYLARFAAMPMIALLMVLLMTSVITGLKTGDCLLIGIPAELRDRRPAALEPLAALVALPVRSIAGIKGGSWVPRGVRGVVAPNADIAEDAEPGAELGSAMNSFSAAANEAIM